MGNRAFDFKTIPPPPNNIFLYVFFEFFEKLVVSIITALAVLVHGHHEQTLQDWKNHSPPFQEQILQLSDNLRDILL